MNKEEFKITISKGKILPYTMFGETHNAVANETETYSFKNVVNDRKDYYNYL